MEPFIKLAQVAEMTGLCVMTLRRYIKNGEGPAFKRSPTGLYLFRRSDVERWIDKLEGSDPKGAA